MRLLFIPLLLLSACASSGPKLHQYKNSSLAQETQIQRTSLLTNLFGYGQISILWEDNDGKHKEHCDFDFWKQGDSLSLSMTKIEKTIAWFGGHGKDTWLFDMTGDETVLSIGGQNEFDMIDDTQVALILFGLEPLPAGKIAVDGEVVTVVDKEDRTWRAKYLPHSFRPHEITMQKEDYSIVAKYFGGRSVEVENMLELQWPETGKKIVLSDSRNTNTITFHFAFLSTIVDDEPFEFVMSLDRLSAKFKPALIAKDN